MKKKLKRLIPLKFKEFVKGLIEEKELNNLKTKNCTVENLRTVNKKEIEGIFTSEGTDQKWEAIKEIIKDLELPEMSGGVNLGDQRAIFYLIRHFEPKTVLEIGTHIGCSTVHITLSLKDIQDSKLITVDIIDVNDSKKKNWLKYGSKYSPEELIEMIDCKEIAEFKKSDSINFLRNTKQNFDFIFLDGSHYTPIVYQDITLALELLNENGIILLHDYYPENKPLWRKNQIIAGPYLAVKRLISEKNNLKVFPLGELPWKTKLDSNTTSLALLLS